MGDSNTPKVSIIIPAYNAAPYLEETLNSIFEQTFKDFEIIIVDDGSTDATKDVIDKFKGKVRYFYQKNSGAPASPRNVAIKNSKGKYIAIFDSDDIMFKEKLEVSVNILEKNNGVDLIFSNFIQILDGVTEDTAWLDKPHVKKVIDSIPQEQLEENVYSFNRPIYQELLLSNFIGTSTVVCKKDIFDDVGYFDESLIGIEDLDMWLHLCQAEKTFAYSTIPLSYYRKHQGGISRQTNTLKSHIGYYTRRHKTEESRENREIMKKRLGRLLFEYGFISKNNGSYREAATYYLKALLVANFPYKITAFFALCKIPVFMILRQKSN